MHTTRVLVTGVAGFMGSHIAEQCIQLGWDVTGIDDLSGGFIENVPPGVHFLQGTVSNTKWVEGLWNETSFDYVYHLAAYAAEGLSHFIRHYNYETNLLGSVNLINQAVIHDVKCFVFTSSIAVYGANQIPMTEELVPRPEDPYGISKYAIELDLAAAHYMFGLPYIIFRPHNVYGERQNIADKYRNVIGILMNQVISHQSMTIFGDGLQTRAFSYIADVAPIIARAPTVTNAYQQVFNVGADQPCTILTLAEKVARTFNVPARINHLPARKEVVHAVASHDKLRNYFSPPSPTSLDEGLARMAQWVLTQGPRSPVGMSEIEVLKGVPPSWLSTH
jgi:UDP-glucose 4-epimerase